MDGKIIEAYKKYQVEVAVIFEAKREEAEKQMHDVLMFEKSMLFKVISP